MEHAYDEVAESDQKKDQYQTDIGLTFRVLPPEFIPGVFIVTSVLLHQNDEKGENRLECPSRHEDVPKIFQTGVWTACVARAI